MAKKPFFRFILLCLGWGIVGGMLEGRSGGVWGVGVFAFPRGAMPGAARSSGAMRHDRGASSASNNLINIGGNVQIQNLVSFTLKIDTTKMGSAGKCFQRPRVCEKKMLTLLGGTFSLCSEDTFSACSEICDLNATF